MVHPPLPSYAPLIRSLDTRAGWDTSSIHLALLGDLFHGRTVHSKVDGLRPEPLAARMGKFSG